MVAFKRNNPGSTTSKDCGCDDGRCWFFEDNFHSDGMGHWSTVSGSVTPTAACTGESAHKSLELAAGAAVAATVTPSNCLGSPEFGNAWIVKANCGTKGAGFPTEQMRMEVRVNGIDDDNYHAVIYSNVGEDGGSNNSW